MRPPPPPQFPGQPGPLGQPLDLPDEWNPLPRPARSFDYRPLPPSSRPDYPMPTDTTDTDTTDTGNTGGSAQSALIIMALSVLIPAGYVVYNWKMLAKGSAWAVLGLLMVAPVLLYVLMVFAIGKMQGK